MNSKEVVAALGALAQDSRLAVYRLLVKRGPEGYAAGEIGERLDIPAPTLSFHLKALAQAGLVTARKEGRYVHYRADIEGMHALVAYLTENCCSLGSVGAPSCAPGDALPVRGRAAARAR